jgi:integrase/recombinase XerC/integrase/recombinase XerD
MAMAGELIPTTTTYPFINIELYVDEFLHSLDVRDSSKETYRKGLINFMRWLNLQSIFQPSREDIISYKKYLLNDKRLSPLTVTAYLTGIRKFFEWTEHKRIYPNIAQDVKSPKRSKGFRRDPLTINQIKRVLDCINRDVLEGKRDYALLNLMLRTGLRTIEVVRTNVGDISQAGGEAVLRIHGKGKDTKDDFVLLTEETLKPLYDYLQALKEEKFNVSDDAPLFVSLSDRNRGQRLTTRSVRRIVKERLRGTGIDSPRLSAHSLRHTFATLALANGAPVIQVKEALRHKSIETTTIYAHAIDRITNGAERYIRF